MHKFSLSVSLTLLTVASLASVAPVAADSFVVTLTSGNTFETRYRPHQSDRDESKVLLLTEFGNWISLPKDAVVSVESDTESRGFGTVLDSQTIALGWIPTSSLPDGDAEGGGEIDPTDRLINFMREQNATPPAPVYNNDLVVEPSASSGIPIGFTSRSTPPLGRAQGSIDQQ